MKIHPMADVEKRAAAKAFAKTWSGRGDEKQDAQNFWRGLLQSVYGVESPESDVRFEYRVTNDQTGSTIFIDAYIPETAVLIEQKSLDVDLNRSYRQSDGSMLTPFQQARRYAGLLPHSMNPRWIVVCNFREFHLHDMNNPNAEPYVLKLSDLEREFPRLSFLISEGSENLRREMELSIRAGELVGELHDALLKQYRDSNDPSTLKSLNALCVRLVFCLYAEDADVFGRHLMFHDYIQAHTPQQTRKALISLFRVLDQKPEERDPYLADDDPLLAAFPYVNGGLFRDENIEIPPITDNIYHLILRDASEDFDWSGISPTIFGAVFESTLNPETRRSGGMHYTSIENIHKVIDPLFLDQLTAELEDILREPIQRIRDRRLAEFQDTLSGLEFLDPAAGSGNFLTESYLCLRRLENRALRALLGTQIRMGDAYNPIKVSITQFHGIEINDFAVTVARTALWIAESQMMKETEDIIHMPLDFLPLKTPAHIVEGHALQIDWASVVSKERLSYIMGNPPFVGARLMSPAQKNDVLSVFGNDWQNVGNLDYVSCWYKKAVDMMKGSYLRTALVSTNSVTQGETVANLWKPLMSDGAHIDFAYRTFRWDSEATHQAHVHCVIVGFSLMPNNAPKVIYDNNQAQVVENINGYLIDGESIFVESRNRPLCDVPEIGIGNKPIDGGSYLFKKDEMEAFVRAEPKSERYFRLWYGSDEFINRRPRYCLWLGDCTPSELRAMPECMKRVQAVHDYRLASTSAGTRKLAERPTRFHVENMPHGNYIIIPRVSSEKRRYIPIGFLSPDALTSDSAHIIPDATLFHFGVLTSNVHMAWMRTVCGRLEMRYRYSKDIVYNNFPWPSPTDAQRQKIVRTAQAILDARDLYPDASLADLYDELTMPSELRKAHQDNDSAVMEAYGIHKGDPAYGSESACVSLLMQLYQRLAVGPINLTR